MSFHQALRAAVYARLITLPSLGAPVFSSPPANLRPPIIAIGQIILDEELDKTSDDGWYLVGIEAAVQGNSPAELDALSDAVTARMKGAELTSPTVQLSVPVLADEADASDPDRPGGPLLVRTQTFRVFAGDL